MNGQQQEQFIPETQITIPPTQLTIPPTQLTIPPTQYGAICHSNYIFPSELDLSLLTSALDLSLFPPHPRYSESNNNAYIAPVPPIPPISIRPQDRPNAHSNNQNDQIQNLIRLRPRPGNPRQAQQYINTYGICRSEEQPMFTQECFDWSVYGIDSNTDEYVCIFKCLQNKNKMIDLKTNLEILDGTIKKCSMSCRAKTIKIIEDTCTDVVWWQQDKCPFSPSVTEQPESSIEDAISTALTEGLNPTKFKMKYPKIGSVKANVNYFTNKYNAQKEEKRKAEQKEAVEWFTPMLTPIQDKVIDIIETARTDYCNLFDTDAKRVLMGNRDAYIFVSPGNRGLTTTGKFMKFKHGEEKVICISGGGKSDDVNTNFHSQLKKATNCQYLVWNVARESAHLWSWNTLEQMSDALTTTNKYNSITEMTPPPTPLIITNKMFELQNPVTKRPNITLDRIHMYQVMAFSDTVQSVDVYQYYQAKYGVDPRAHVNERQEIELKDL